MPAQASIRQGKNATKPTLEYES